jgi:hypothetical protein
MISCVAYRQYELVSDYGASTKGNNYNTMLQSVVLESR